MGTVIFLYFLAGFVVNIVAGNATDSTSLVHITSILVILVVIMPMSKRIYFINRLFYKPVLNADPRSSLDRGIQAFFGGFFGDIEVILDACRDKSYQDIKRTMLSHTIFIAAVIISIYVYKEGLYMRVLQNMESIALWLPKLI